MTTVANRAGFTVVRAGLVAYQEAWETQRRRHAAVLAGEAPDTVLLLEHPPVYTAGRRTSPAERPWDGTPVVETDRGGKITWHGPGQLVGYPILRLPLPIDLVAYVRRLERVIMATCAELGLATIRVDGRTGVWVPAAGQRTERKIAAIGVRVVRQVTLHGFALNCDCDLSAYDRIVPCGISDAGVTSLSVELGRKVTVAEVLPIVERHLSLLYPDAAISQDSALRHDAALAKDQIVAGGREPAAGRDPRRLSE